MCFVVIVKTETETLFYGGRCFNGVALFDIFLDKKNLLSKNINIFVTPPYKLYTFCATRLIIFLDKAKAYFLKFTKLIQNSTSFKKRWNHFHLKLIQISVTFEFFHPLKGVADRIR
jgi:hypothetical protein